jgi:hypothetical protein
MAIGDQVVNDATISSSELKTKYDTLIKEAIIKARPHMEVVRADDVAIPGTITTDIITRIMHSDYVVADVTYPNPNVFYELGLRHACKAGTIIIKDKNGPRVPFDIAHLRYIEYENTTAGLRSLATQLASFFNHFERDPAKPDNHFLELAKLTSYIFPNYSKEEPLSPELQLIKAITESPDLLDLFTRQQSGEEIDQAEILRRLFSNPNAAMPIFQAMQRSGELTPLSKK